MEVPPTLPNKPIGVIILNWNGEKMLREYLPSVLRHTPTQIADVIVADNGSTDGSVKLLRESFPQARLIEFTENHGFAEGYNKAIALTGYTYAVLLNSDVRVESDWLTPLYAWMESHPDAGAVQPKIKSAIEPSKFEYAGAAGGMLDRNGFPYCRGRIFSHTETDCGQYDEPMLVDWASGACLMVRTKAYEEAGGLDSRFFAHMEEIDLCWRMRLSGHGVWAIGSSEVFHLGGGSLSASNPRKTYLNFRNNLLMLFKNLPAKVRNGTLIRRRLIDTLAWAKSVASLKFGDAAAIVKAHRDFAKMRTYYLAQQLPEANLLADRPNILIQYYLLGRKTWTKISRR